MFIDRRQGINPKTAAERKKRILVSDLFALPETIRRTADDRIFGLRTGGALPSLESLFLGEFL
jgi:hypothetical protein